MLNTELISKIEEFIYKNPRSIQEIAQFIGKNWRTADRYIEQIKKEHGTLETKTFREGTRGALKIVYWAAIEKRNQTVFQEELEKQILSLKKKEDFSSFDIFQFVDSKNKEAYAKKAINEVAVGKLDVFRKFLLNTKKQLLFFSGNLSFINYKDSEGEVFQTLDILAKRGIKMKVLCRVDIIGKENIERMLSLNSKYGREIVEIKHREQPLRLTIVDSKMFNMKDIINPSTRIKEFKKRIIVFYTIKDKKWTEWISNIFFKMFNNSIGAEKRLEEMNRIFK